MRPTESKVFNLKALVLLGVFSSLFFTLYTNCSRAILGQGSYSSTGTVANTQSVTTGTATCATGQVAIGVTADQNSICAPLDTVTGTMCPADESLYLISSTQVLCVLNTSWDQTGSVCPVGQYLTAFTTNGAISCAAPTSSTGTGGTGTTGTGGTGTTGTGGTGSGTTGTGLTFYCPTGQYVNGVVNGQPVCAALPSNFPTPSMCYPGTFLNDLQTTGADCEVPPWLTGSTQTCPAGTYALGYLKGNLLCGQNLFTGTTTVSCPSGQILLSYTNGSANCSAPPNPDISHACPAGSNVSSISANSITCQSAGPAGGPQCGPGKFVTGLAGGLPVCSVVPNNHLPASCPNQTYPMGTSNGALVCAPFLNVAAPPTTSFCSANATNLCAVVGGIGNEVCNASGSAYSSCSALQCTSGFNLVNGSCVQTACSPGSAQNCQIANGKGMQFCGTLGTWNACQVTSCSSGYFANKGSCAADQCVPNSNLACASGPANGFQLCASNGSSYGACFYTSCQNGWTLKNQACVDTSPPRISFPIALPNPVYGNSVSITYSAVDNETSVQTVTCSLDGNPVSSCTSPVTISNLQTGMHTFSVTAVDTSGNSATKSTSWNTSACASGATNQCAVPNGGGTQLCQANGIYGTCTPTTCNAAYSLINGSCAALNCGPGYSVSGNSCVDNIPPAVSITAAPSDPTIGTSAQIMFSATDAGSGISSVTCQVDSQTPAACQSPFTLTNLGLGQHKVVISATDGTGNVTTKTATWNNYACSPGAVASCGVNNGTGSETCTANGSGYGACQVASCQSGYSQSGNSCVYVPKTCALPWGGTVNSGASVTAYSSSSVAWGQTCTSQSRSCQDGTLSGSYTSGSCTVAQPPGHQVYSGFIWTPAWSNPTWTWGTPYCPSEWPGGSGCGPKGTRCWVNTGWWWDDDSGGNMFNSYTCQ